MLGQSQAYKFILGARDPKRAQAAYDELKYDKKHRLIILPLELSDLQSVKTFGKDTLDMLAQDNLDYLFLNAAMIKETAEPGPHGSKWCGAYIVNHLGMLLVYYMRPVLTQNLQLAQHYLTHILREKLTTSKSRLVIVSSGGFRQVTDPSR